MNAGAVEAHVPGERLPGEERQATSQEERRIPEHEPGLDAPLLVEDELLPVVVGAVEVELPSHVSAELPHQGQVPTVFAPGPVPCAPSPAERHAQEVGIVVGGGFHRIRAGRNVHHGGLVFVEVEGFVHEAQEVRRDQQVVLQHHHPAMLGADGGDALDDGVGEAQVGLPFHDRYRSKARQSPHDVAHLADRRPGRLVAWSVAEHIEVGARGLRVREQRCEHPMRVRRAIVDERYYGSRLVHARRYPRGSSGVCCAARYHS